MVLLRILKYVPFILLSIFFIGSVLSCKEPISRTAQGSPYNENILRFDVNAPFTSLDPTAVRASGSNNIFPLLYSYLFVPNISGDLEPDLATKWSYDPSRCTWTIYLRKNALFHNGWPVTSKDVKYSFEAMLKKVNPGLGALIARIAAVSDTVLMIELRTNDSDFPKKAWTFEIIPHPNGDRIDYHNHPIGSGSFKFAYRKGEKEVALVANEDYYGGRPSLDRVIFYYQPDKEKAWTRLLSGKTDIAQEISPKNYEIITGHEKRFYFDLYTMRYYTILLYNNTDPLFSDRTVRLALSHAIDREYIVNSVLRGYGKVAVGPMGVDSPFHDPHLKPVPFSPQKGLRLLKEAGWSYDEERHCLVKGGKCFEFTILVFEELQAEKKVAQYIKLCLNDIGIKARLQCLTYGDLLRRYVENNEFQAVLTEFTGAYRRPDNLMETWCPLLSKKSDAGSFEHPAVTRLIQEAIEESDTSKQKDFFHQVDAMITSLQPGTFLFHKKAIDVMSKRFALPFPFTLTHSGIYHLRYASLKTDELMGS